MNKKIAIAVSAVAIVSASILIVSDSESLSSKTTPAVKQESEKKVVRTTENGMIKDSILLEGPSKNELQTYADLDQAVEKELTKLGSTYRKARANAKKDYHRFCHEIEQLDEKIVELDFERDQKIAALNDRQNIEKELAQIIHDHMYEVQFLAVVKTQCKKNKG